ncbi:hypothetical protein J6590_015127 [Homalodisca vitripennis]|nr:hypothetical protein J6590_015127 [Homalodisca vitripennis]
MPQRAERRGHSWLFVHSLRDSRGLPSPPPHPPACAMAVSMSSKDSDSAHLNFDSHIITQLGIVLWECFGGTSAYMIVVPERLLTLSCGEVGSILVLTGEPNIITHRVCEHFVDTVQDRGSREVSECELNHRKD